jgi:N-acylneuraminate cytidylyltransferase
MSLIAIIPARGGSKRIQNKNIRPFCGRPMIAYALEAARQSGLFGVIHVSTDDAAIRNTAAQLGYEPDFLRPAALADDHVGVMPVLDYVVNEYARRDRTFGGACLIYACAPLLLPEDLIAAAKMFDQHGGKKMVLGVTSYPAPVEWAFRIAPDGLLIADNQASHAIRSQDLQHAYYDSGMLAIHPISDFVPGADLKARPTVPYILPRLRVVDIDTAEDWEMAETLYLGHQHRRRS